MTALDPFAQLAAWWPTIQAVASVGVLVVMLTGLGLGALALLGAGRIDPDTTTRRMYRAIGPLVGAGVLAVVVFGIPAIVELLPRTSPATAGMINATITTMSLAVIAVCSVVFLRRTRRH
jgi:hypothetical protein